MTIFRLEDEIETYLAVAVVVTKHYSGICLQRLRKITKKKNLSDSRCLGHDSENGYDGGMGLSASGHRLAVASCEHGNKPLSKI
jgi:hypothetical protein